MNIIYFFAVKIRVIPYFSISDLKLRKYNLTVVAIYFPCFGNRRAIQFEFLFKKDFFLNVFQPQNRFSLIAAVVYDINFTPVRYTLYRLLG